MMAITIDNKYETINSIHIGEDTDVYRCLDKEANQTFLVKYPHHEYPPEQVIASLNHEYHLLQILKNGHFVQAVTLLHPSTYPILVMKDFEGVTLDTFLDQKPVKLPTFFKIAKQLVDTIGHLHRKHIVHKGVNPTNILIQPKQLKVKLGGLGIASEVSEEAYLSGEPQWSEYDLPYMAPEQTGRINHPIDLRTDLYALGITFFKMLTGQLPFKGDDILEWVYCHVAKAPPQVTDYNPEVPPPLAQIIAKLLAKSPDKRYASIFGLQADLSECEHQWREHHKIQSFELGRKDIHDQLYFTHHLYGRDQVLTTLNEAFERIRQGPRELFLVAGYAGIGKTAVIQALGPAVMSEQGYFVQGKFDQLKRDVPFSAIIIALQSLVNQLLTLSEEKLNQWHRDFNEALGNLGQIIIDVVPEAELILGEQPQLPEVPPEQAENRFNLAFQRFIEVFAESQHPLVIFLDDLQWADLASLKWLELILEDVDLKNTLIIGAYRSNEVDESHPLNLTLTHLSQAEVPLTCMELLPLYTTDVKQMLADIFACSRDETRELADALYAKTQGNPFFMRELLKSWHQDNIVYFDYDTGRWQWDLEKIQAATVTENVIDWLSLKIDTLSQTTQHVLQRAACIGYQFRLDTLKDITELDGFKVVRSVWEAIQARILVPVEPSYRTQALAQKETTDTTPTLSDKILKELHYRFIHDRIQQSIEARIPDDQKQPLHRQIGQLLTQNQPLRPENEQLFDILYHFNQSLSLVSDPDEQYRLAEANLWAAEKANKATAYRTALNYTDFGFQLLPKDPWTHQYKLTFNLHKVVAECHYLTGELEVAEQYINTALQNAHSLNDELQVASLYLTLLGITNRPREALQVGLRWLNQLGISPPIQITRRPKLVSILYTLNGPILKMIIQMNFRKSKTKIIRPLKQYTKDSNVKHSLAIMSQLIIFALLVDKMTYIYIASQMTRLSLKHGATNQTLLGLLGYATVLLFEMGLVRTGFAITDMLDAWTKTWSDSPAQQADFIFHKTFFITTWRRHWSECIESFRNSYQIALENGKLDQANYSLRNVFRYTLKTKTIPEAGAVLKQVKDFSHKYKIRQFESVAHIQRFLVDFLAGQRKPDLNALKGIEAEALKRQNHIELSAVYYFYLVIAYTLKDFRLAMEIGDKHQRYAKGLIGESLSIVGYTFYALSLAAGYEVTKNVQLRKQRFRRLKAMCHTLQRTAKKYPCPHFETFAKMAQAEKARVLNKPKKARALYQQAIALAKHQDLLSMLGYIYEGAASVENDQEALRSAQDYVRKAHHAYASWGAVFKCQLLEKEYPEWTPQTSKAQEAIEEIPSASQDLDVFAILKSSQAISEEIKLDQLLQKLLNTMVQEAGAERAVLIYRQDNVSHVEAEADTEQIQTRLSAMMPIQERHDLPLNLLNYVERTQKPLIWEKGASDQMEFKDKYLDDIQPETLLALPITYQGQLRRILYLENRASKHRFTQKHLQSLTLLASQAAISLENATLYYRATHDVLTGLANRSYLQEEFDRRAVEEDKRIAIVFQDLDKFKLINDEYGHEAGDKVLVELGKRLQHSLRQHDIAARLGGDEFVLMLDPVKNRRDVETIMESILDKLKSPVKINGYECELKASIGISFYPEDGEDLDALLKCADETLYQVKEQGGGRYRFHERAKSS